MLLGGWSDDMRNGFGMYTYQNKDTYEGEWSNNVRHGTGTYTYAASGAKYAGNWLNGRREGIGELLFPNCKYRGQFASDQVWCWTCNSLTLINLSYLAAWKWVLHI